MSKFTKLKSCSHIVCAKTFYSELVVSFHFCVALSHSHTSDAMQWKCFLMKKFGKFIFTFTLSWSLHSLFTSTRWSLPYPINTIHSSRELSERVRENSRSQNNLAWSEGKVAPFSHHEKKKHKTANDLQFSTRCCWWFYFYFYILTLAITQRKYSAADDDG